MNAVDGSEHYEKESNEPPPSLLAIVLDTNPHAWEVLAPRLPFSKVIANILVFVNAHLAFNHANQVAVVASHSDRAQWLYPAPPASTVRQPEDSHGAGPTEEDMEMPDSTTIQEAEGHTGPKLKLNFKRSQTQAPANESPSEVPVQNSVPSTDANKYRPFRAIEDVLMASTRSLISTTSPTALINSNTTMLAGALTLALAYINKQTVLTSKTGEVNPSSYGGTTATSQDLTSRILVISVSSDSAMQYIPVMNAIFAAQRSRIPIDVLKLHDETTFLQQASDATNGIYIAPDSPGGLLQYLMMAFLPDQTSRKHLILPSQSNVDFRAACFCHKKVIDVGFVCSICLSIFCEPPDEGICLTCGTHLALGEYGAKPAVVAKRKKKKKRVLLSGNDTPAGSRSATPGLR